MNFVYARKLLCVIDGLFSYFTDKNISSYLPLFLLRSIACAHGKEF